MKGTCSVENCDKESRTRGLCASHYQKWWQVNRKPGARKRRTDVLVRIMRRVEKRDDGCWIWTGYCMPFGHGQINLGYEEGRALVHRVVYERMVGPVPDGLELDHLCRVPACCNPEHLEPVLHLVNVRRGIGGQVQKALHASRTTCKAGHPYTPENTRRTTDGRRVCRACHREWARAARKRERGAA